MGREREEGERWRGRKKRRKKEKQDFNGGHQAEGAVHNVNAHRIRQATQTLLCTFLSPSTTWVMQTSACKTPKKIMKIKFKTKKKPNPKGMGGMGEKTSTKKKKSKKPASRWGGRAQRGRNNPPENTWSGDKAKPSTTHPTREREKGGKTQTKGEKGRGGGEEKMRGGKVGMWGESIRLSRGEGVEPRRAGVCVGGFCSRRGMHMYREIYVLCRGYR